MTDVEQYLTDAASELQHLDAVEGVDVSAGGARPSVRLSVADATPGAPLPAAVAAAVYDHGLAVYSYGSGSLLVTLSTEEPQ